MPKATVTIRELKNKDTGIDLSVTSYQEIPGTVLSTYEYQIVVVTNLSCFKLPSHKENDVVQFTLFKKFTEFEDLRARLNEAFSGTVFPVLAKKSIIVSEAIIKERRNSLDSFLRFISATPRVVTCSHVLSFLGVDKQKAQNFAGGDDGSAVHQDDGSEGDKIKNEGVVMEKSSSSLFGGEGGVEEEDGAEFISSSNASDDESLFTATDNIGKPSVDGAFRLFEEQDLKREITEEDEKDFSFVTDAIILKKKGVDKSDEEGDGDDDLLHVEEEIDLEKLLSLQSGAQGSKEEIPAKSLSSPTEKLSRQQQSELHAAHKPTIPAKPVLGPRPAMPRPTPAKPASEVDRPGSVGAKPAVPKKPKPSSNSESRRPMMPETTKLVSQNQQASSSGQTEAEYPVMVVKKKDDLSSDDIMQYIVANRTEVEGDSDDLFA